MFIDKEWKKNSKKEDDRLGYLDEPKQTRPLYLVIVVVFFILASFFIFFYYINSDFYILSRNPVVFVPRNDNGSSTSVLPLYFGDNNPKIGEDYIPDDLRAEDLHFGSFYVKPKENTLSTVKQFSLPLNIKSDVVNYYDVSRRINIEASIENLNENAFAVLETQFDSEKSDFFQMYRKLIKNELPIFISSDFIRYYNQNVQKQVYKEIEKSVFYENLWDICKKLYDISLARYQNHLEEAGLTNDPVLEGKRLETAFLAVALELLRPKKDQINDNENFSEEHLFTEQESQAYYFNIPRDLQREVFKEVALVYAGEIEEQSPIFLYKKNYKNFSLPEEYKKDFKLKNYYLAKKWMNSLFPIYYRSEDCEDCLLDYNDWLNNFAAINLLTNDFADNQDLKNRWAAIYKFIAFFEGLRSDLTYLHLSKANSEVFDDKDVLSLLFKENDEQVVYIKKVQTELEKFSFLPIEGKVGRDNIEEKPFIGIRLLQNNFWPNEYIFSELTGGEITKEYYPEINKRTTECRSSEIVTYFRCLGFSGDILNIYNIVPENNEYYTVNFDYLNYKKGVTRVLDQLKTFDNGTWNSNIFWLNFDLSNTVIRSSVSFIDRMSLNKKWTEEKITNEILGSWVNVALPRDEWESYEEEKNKSLGFISECSLYSYIEPQIELYTDMIERNKMLLRAIEILRVGKKTNAATLILTELNNKLVKFKNIAQKELNGKAINEEECYELNEIISDINVVQSGDKRYVIKNVNGEIQVSIKGVKLIAFVKMQEEDKKVLVVGPVFNFEEKNKRYR